MIVPRSSVDILARLLRQVRLSAGLRQSDLAARLAVPQSFVSKYETAERRLDVLELRLVCLALGVDIRQFIVRLEAALDAPEP
jgi:transcriptional regulator with XRE-family HTH domain